MRTWPILLDIVMAGQVQKVGLEKHPKEDKKFIQYGTAGFRTK